MEPRPRELRIYQTSAGRLPFDEWLKSLRDRQARAKIRVRLERVEDGNFGKVGTVGEGVMELKIDFGPGYRVYYALDGPSVVLLLWGGEKHTQQRDIEKAKAFWRDYQERKDRND